MQKGHIGLVGDVHPDAHYGRYANGCKIVHNTFSDVLSTHIDISAIMCVRMHITGEVYVSFLHMMFVFRTLLYECSIH